MPFNGSGGFVSVGAPDFPAVDGTTILASQYNNQLNDIFNGLSNAVTRDGQSPATANLPMAGFKHTNVGPATAANQYLVYGQSAAALADLTLSGAFTANGVATFNNSVGFTNGITFTSITPDVTGTRNFGTGLLEVATYYGRNLERTTAGDLTINASNVGGAIALRVGGAEIGRLNSTGLGIGSITATEKLDVFGNAARFRDAAYSGYAGKGSALLVGGAASDFAVYASTGSLLFGTGANAIRMMIDASGNVGIGATPSGYKLDLGTTGVGSVGGVGNISGYSDSGAYTISAGRTVGNGGYVQLYGGSHASPNLVIFGTNGAERGRFDANGWFGVGVAPTSLLDISKGGANIQARVRAGAGFIAALQLCGNNTTAGTSSFDLQQDSLGNVDIVQRNAGRMSLYTNNIERLQLTAAGQLFAHAIHNNAGGASGTTPMVASGTGSLTATAVTNCSGVSGVAGIWTRVGNVVTLSGSVTLTVTSSTTLTEVDITPVIPSGFTTSVDARGTSTLFFSLTTVSSGGGVVSEPGGDKIRINATSPAGSAGLPGVFYFTAQYEVR